MISPPKGSYHKKVIIVHDSTQEWEIEVPWCCSGCGYDTRTQPVLEFFPNTGFSYHTWSRTCFCMQPEFHWDLLEQARLYGQIISKGGTVYSPPNKNGVHCVRCGIHCPYTSEMNYACWSCRTYPFFKGSADDNDI